MTRTMRKYQKWLMVGFGTLLMLVFLAPQAIERLGQASANTVVGKINGQPLRALEQQKAAQEIHAWDELGRLLPSGAFQLGIQERDSTHWLLLTREAKAAGLVGEAENGLEFLNDSAAGFAQSYLQYLMQNDFQFIIRLQQIQNPEEQRRFVEQFVADTEKTFRDRTLGSLAAAGLKSDEIAHALAKLQGVHQLRGAYLTAPRISDRLAHSRARTEHDAVVGDYLFIPAEKLTERIPDPDEQALQAHFEQYKSTKPGEGEYGIGYFLPPRVKLEYLKLDRQAVEEAIPVDPVEARKHYTQNRQRFPGEFAQERANVERELRSSRAEDLLSEAHKLIQREVQKVTRKLEAQGRMRILPADWEQQRPKFQDLAAAVVEHLRISRNVTIPLPEVVTVEGWQTRAELAQLPGIGRSELRQGGIVVPFPEVVFWTRELGGSGVLPIQAGVPVIDNYVAEFTEMWDAGGRKQRELNRYFFTVLATREESAPDSLDEIRERVVEDFKRIAAFEQLKGQLETLKQTAAAEGLGKVAEEYNLKTPADPENPSALPPPDPVRSAVRISRAGRMLRQDRPHSWEPALQDTAVRTALMDQVKELDPLAPPDQLPAQEATITAAAPKELGVVIYRVKQMEPVTVELLQSPQVDQTLVQEILQEQVAEGVKEAFSLGALLKRNVVVFGEKRISTPEELRRSESEG